MPTQGMSEQAPQPSDRLAIGLFTLAGLSGAIPVFLFLAGGTLHNERGFGLMWGALAALVPALAASTLFAVGGFFVRARRDYGRVAGAAMALAGLTMGCGGAAVWLNFFRWGRGFFV